MSNDVVIIGCGPVGALAANLLGKAGLSVVVLEKETDLHPLPRAVHIDHEMLRLCQSAGVIERVLGDLRETDGHLHVGADHGVIRYLGTVGKPRPFGWANDYFFYQPEFEAHLREGFADRANVQLLTGAEFTGLEAFDETVRVHYRLAGTDREITARWVIACDGSRSPVRKSLGIQLDDLNFEEPWLVVDAEVEGPVRFPDLTGVPAEADLQRLSVMMCDPERPTTVVPGRGNHRRWEFMLLPGENDAEMMEPESVARLLQPYLRDVPHRLVRAATYRFHGLVAEEWQRRNVFLAGDAAHQTPPFFGQGMCHGFRDVANLAWKMAAIAQQGADSSVLDTYQPERDPHVRAVIGAAVSAGRYICMLEHNEAATRDRDMRARPDFGRSQTAADLIPALAGGILVKGTLGAGERFIQPRLANGLLLDDATGGGWRLFVRAAAITGSDTAVTRIDASDLSDHGMLLSWLDSHAADAVLVRPDHYVFGTAVGDTTQLLSMRRQALRLPELEMAQ
jgi:3-(3-hydroxy-phenyl)propionate hydroxylase